MCCGFAFLQLCSALWVVLIDTCSSLWMDFNCMRFAYLCEHCRLVGNIEISRSLDCYQIEINDLILLGI